MLLPQDYSLHTWIGLRWLKTAKKKRKQKQKLQKISDKFISFV